MDQANKVTSDGKNQESVPFGVERDNDDVFVRIISSALKETLRNYLQSECLYELKPKVVLYIKS
jgi:hypothetical protein